jgi:hypothetical protein
MGDTSYLNTTKDPVDGSISRYIGFRSATKGGQSTSFKGVNDVTVPASPNFPNISFGGTATRYMIYLPVDIDYQSSASTSYTVTNETQSRDLAIVDPSATLTDYTCKFANNAGDVLNTLEVHVGSTSSQGSDTLSIQGLTIGSNINSTNFDSMNIAELTLAGDLTGVNNLEIGVKISDTTTDSTFEIIQATGRFNGGGLGVNIHDYSTATNPSLASTDVLRMHIHKLGSWDMNAVQSRPVSVFGSPNMLNVWIEGDDGIFYESGYNSTSNQTQTITVQDLTPPLGNWIVNLTISTWSTFAQNANFNGSSNRGFLTYFY